MFGFLRSDELDDKRMRAKYRSGIERLDLIATTLSAALLDTIFLPITLTSTIVANTFNFTGATTRTKNRAMKRAKKIYAKYNEEKLEMLKYMYENDLIDTDIKVYQDNRIWPKKNTKVLKFWEINDLKKLALQEKENGNIEGYTKFKNLANKLNENHCINFGYDIESNKINWDDEKEEKNEDQFYKIIDDCKEAGLSKEETLKALQDAGYEPKEEKEQTEEKSNKSLEEDLDNIETL